MDIARTHCFELRCAMECDITLAGTLRIWTITTRSNIYKMKRSELGRNNYLAVFPNLDGIGTLLCIKETYS